MLFKAIKSGVQPMRAARRNGAQFLGGWWRRKLKKPKQMLRNEAGGAG